MTDQNGTANRSPSNADRVAMAHQYTVDLENTVKALQAENSDLQARLHSTAHILEQSEVSRAKLELEVSYYKSRCAEIVAMLRASGKLILEAIRDPRDIVAKYMPPEEQQRDLERAITGNVEPAAAPSTDPAPSFLMRPSNG